MRISDWSSDVCSSDLRLPREPHRGSDLGRLWRNRGRCGIYAPRAYHHSVQPAFREQRDRRHAGAGDIEHSAALSLRIADGGCRNFRSEEHTSELQSLMRISYAVFCLKKTNHKTPITYTKTTTT